MPTPLAGGLENSFAPQMIFLWPPARGVGKQDISCNKGSFPRLNYVEKISEPLQIANFAQSFWSFDLERPYISQMIKKVKVKFRI